MRFAYYRQFFRWNFFEIVEKEIYFLSSWLFSFQYRVPITVKRASTVTGSSTFKISTPSKIK